MMMMLVGIGNGRVLLDDGYRQDVISDGRFSTWSAIWYKKLEVKLPTLGNNCRAILQFGGIFFEVPYMTGDAQLKVRYSTEAGRDDLKSDLCRLMQTGERKDVFATQSITGGEFIIFTNDNGLVFISHSSFAFGGMGGGTLRFEGCSC